MNENLLHVACPRCKAKNRVPEARLSAKPNCGRCHEPLFDGRPAVLTEPMFDAFVAGTDIPVVLDCWAPWCGPCRSFAPTFEDAARRLEPGVRFAKLDTETNPDLARRLGIRSIPTLIVFQGGRELARTTGALSMPDLMRWLAETLGAR